MIKIFIVGYLIGLLVFYTFAAFHQPVWAIVYYLWDKSVGGGFIGWAVIYKYAKDYRVYTAYTLLLATIRFVWEIISAITGLSVNNSWAVSILFIATVLIISVFILRGDGRLNKWLSKHLFS